MCSRPFEETVSAAPRPGVEEVRAARSRLLLASAVALPLAALSWSLPALLPAAIRDLSQGAALALPLALALAWLGHGRAHRGPVPSAEEGAGVAPVIRLHPREAPLAPPHDGTARSRSPARARRR